MNCWCFVRFPICLVERHLDGVVFGGNVCLKRHHNRLGLISLPPRVIVRAGNLFLVTSFCLSVCQSVHMFVSLSLRLCICLSLHPWRVKPVPGVCCRHDPVAVVLRPHSSDVFRPRRPKYHHPASPTRHPYTRRRTTTVTLSDECRVLNNISDKYRQLCRRNQSKKLID